MSLRGRRHGGGRKNELVFLTTCGPATTFDPKITGPNGTWFFDDGTTLAAASGAEISKTFAADGLHRAVFRPGAGGLAAITAMDCSGDCVIQLDNLSRCTLGTVVCLNNPGLVIRISEIPRATTFNISSGTLATGTPSQISRSATYIAITNSPGLVGGLSDFPVTTQTLVIYGCTSITAGSVAGFVVARDFRLYSMGWLAADVDTVIDSMWAARANYTYAAPALQIGGTNEAPTGNVAAPTEGADWTEDTPGHWLPRTTGAKAYDLAKDVNGEGFNKWTITYTGGVVAP